MKTRIAVILILVAEIFAALLVGVILLPNESCGHKTLTTPSYFTPSLLITFILLLIAACILWTKTTKAVWFGCVTLALINVGIMCWGAIYYLGSHCDGVYQIRPEIGLAQISIIAAAIITLSLPFFLSDIKRIIHRTTAGNTENKTNSSFPVITFILIISIPIMLIIMESCSGGVYGSCKEGAYASNHDEIQNAVAYYMSDSNNSSQLPIISENATFTLTNPNGSYYIINMSPLLASNGGLLREVPDSCGELQGPNNDNCDSGAIGCSNSNHYVWGMDNLGNVVSKLINSDNVNPCACDACDGYQGVWP